VGDLVLEKSSKIYIAGHLGLVGSSIYKALKAEGYTNLLTITRENLDLCDQKEVNKFFAAERPEYVFLAAALVGGIHANNTYPADFIRDNLLVQTNVIDSAYNNGCRKLLFLGSSCIYPKLAPQPIREEHLLTGFLEPTNECYAIAKIAGLKMVQAYRRQYGFSGISIMPTNLYGPGDNFDLESSHVIPALIRRFHEAKKQSEKSVKVWGSGKPRREFLYIDDLADASVFLMKHYDEDEIINVGCGKDVTIRETAELISEITGFDGDIIFDTSKPDGTPRKLLDVSRLNALRWNAKTPLKEGLAKTYNWFCSNEETVRKNERISKQSRPAFPD